MKHLSFDARIRLLTFAIGFAPIASLSLSTFEIIPLHISGPLVVLPALLLALSMGNLFPDYGKLMLKGLRLGLVAVTMYDCSRFPFVAAGLWGDFIPKIGNYLLNRDGVHWSVGYAWRYLGNGGGMGMAFYMVAPLISERIKRVHLGVIYGVGVFACLIATLYLSPSGTKYLFTPSALSFTVGLIGHVIFGAVLGAGVAREAKKLQLVPAKISVPAQARALAA